MKLRKKRKVIRSFRGKYFFLSNFCQSYIWTGGLFFPTVEHAYQASKAWLMCDAKKIQKAATPSKAKRLGRKIKVLQPDWRFNRLKTMEKLLKRKFAKPAFMKRLLATGDARLVEENTWGDTFWGKCDGEGKNYLGKLLMQIRRDVRSGKLKTRRI